MLFCFLALVIPGIGAAVKYMYYLGSRGRHVTSMEAKTYEGYEETLVRLHSFDSEDNCSLFRYSSFLDTPSVQYLLSRASPTGIIA